MQTQNKTVKKIIEAYGEIKTLSEIAALLSWDQNTYMPPRAASGRAVQVQAIEALVTEKWNNKELLSLIQDIDSSGLSEEESAVLRQARRATKYYTLVPKDLILKNAKVTAEAFSIWQEAREKNDFALFSPALTEVFDLQRQIAKHLGYKDSPYDALLDLYEPGLTSKDCEEMFTQIRQGLGDLVQKIGRKHEAEKARLFDGEHTFDQDAQRQLSEAVMKQMGYEAGRGRLDISTHPFTTELGEHDIRITTRYNSHDLRVSLMSTIHEAGHGLYELGLDSAYAHTPLAGGVSLGVHESQSRFWENMVGRSREFFTWLQPLVVKHFPTLSHVSPEDLYREFNIVSPSLIRVEADELTYNFHIILRYEIEKAIIEGDMEVGGIPKVWKQKMQKYLGVDVPDNASGCLQDVHWAYGSVGYFPTYTIGSIYSAQIEAAVAQPLGLQSLVGRGEFSPILAWLRENIHRHGSRYTPKDLMSRAVGSQLDVAPYIAYLTKKYTALYGVEASA